MAVYRDLDHAQLDREYNARATVPDIQPFLRRYTEESARMRATLPCQLDVAFGPTPDETLDIFPAASGGALSPVLVFIHGGYWRLLARVSGLLGPRGTPCRSKRGADSRIPAPASKGARSY